MKLSEIPIRFRHISVAELRRVLLSCFKLVAEYNLFKQVHDAITVKDVV
jgi:hypothetical protein